MTDARPSLAAVICTFNGEPVLDDCLSALDRQDDDLDVLIVDNASTDATAAIARRWTEERPRWRVVEETEPGLCAARNRAIREVTADVVAYIDDDARPWPRWSAAMRDAFSAREIVAAGGPIILSWGRPRPGWLPQHADTYLTTLDPASSTTTLTWPEYPFGANMAFRRTTLEQLGGFDLQLGRMGRSLRSGEETALFSELHERGGAVAYVPDAGVDHAVQAERCSMRFMLRRAFAQGQTQVLLHAARTDLKRRRLILHVLTSALVGTARTIPSTLRLRSADDGVVAVAVLLLLELARSAGNTLELASLLRT